MGKYISVMVLLVLVVVVMAMVCEAQSNRSNNNSRRRENRNQNNNSNSSGDDNNDNNNNPARNSNRRRGRNRNQNNNNRNNSESGNGVNNNNNNSNSDNSNRNNSTTSNTNNNNRRQGQRGNARRRENGNRAGRRRGGSRRRRPHPSCEEIHLPMCKGLVPYTHTKLPNRYNHTTQREVYRVLEHMWAHMDHSCSRNMRLMLCSMYLPKCRGPHPGLPPCKRTCMAARRKCSRPLNEMLGLVWGEKFVCRELPNRRCLRPIRERRCEQEYPQCIRNDVFPVCANLTFTYGTIPNMFQQCDLQDINTEISYYDALRGTNCHEHLNFMLCGVYSPFCIRDDRPFTFPCRELCEEIRTSCEADYRRLYHDLPWPNKLQCHRYPSTTDENYSCVMPNEGSTYLVPS